MKEAPEENLLWINDTFLNVLLVGKKMYPTSFLLELICIF